MTGQRRWEAGTPLATAEHTLPLLAWSFFALMAGCGGSTHDTARGHPGEADVTDAGIDAPAAWSPLCPNAAPPQGSSCSSDGLYCEYGDSFVPECNAVLVCVSGAWGEAVLYGMGDPCDAGANPSSCPAGESEIDAGSSCSVVETCVYPQGTCECAVPEEGTASASANATWFCGPESGCPVPRPRVGSACTSPGQRCDYEVCGNSQVCSGGVWQTVVGACGG